MKLDDDEPPQALVYQAGLNPISEAVISSHFMHRLCRDPCLEPYDAERFAGSSIAIPRGLIDSRLLPALRRAAECFARDRAAAAKRRAAQYLTRYGRAEPSGLGAAEFITEVMFDRQFRSAPRETCARRDLCGIVTRRMAAGAPIEMAIAALPYKISSPLKTRGPQPDLAEANFMLELYEIVTAVEILYREARPDLRGPLARFTIVSDGSRFNALTREPAITVAAYRRALGRWRDALRLADHIELLDYRALLSDRLPAAARGEKERLRQQAIRQYSERMWSLFDPCDMAATLREAARHDPDPELDNPRGRFVSLLESLIYTVNYRGLEPYAAWPAERFRALYRELTGHIFEPFAQRPPADPQRPEEQIEGGVPSDPPPWVKERLRQDMLKEAWSTAIAYIAEIKSDREQASDPISACLPNHLRWTVHAKPGQLGLLTPFALGKPVLPWTGAAVFRRTGRDGIRLCTLPVLALEGAGAIPVGIGAAGDRLEPSAQPLFFIYPDVAFADLDDFLASVESRLVRRRTS